MPRKLTTKEFIQKAISVHGDRYDYSQVEYMNSRIKVTIICPEHEPFEQKPASHIEGHGCPSCAGNAKLTTEEFILKAIDVHGDRYDYSQVEYVNTHILVTIICPVHGPFEQKPNSHLNGQGCPSCGVGNRTSTTEEFIQKAQDVHGDRYDYSQVEYVGVLSKVTIICPEHGPFKQRPSCHLTGRGCPSCNNSKGEASIADFLTLQDIPFIREHKFTNCVDKKHLPFDFYLPNHNICIEFDGKQHFQPVEYFGGEEAFIEQQRKDAIKDVYCEDNGVKLVRIPYTDYDNISSILELELRPPRS